MPWLEDLKFPRGYQMGTHIKIYESKKDVCSYTKYLFDEYEKNAKKKKVLELQRNQENLKIDEQIDKNKDNINSNVIKLRDDEPSRYYCLDGIFI